MLGCQQMLLLTSGGFDPNKLSGLVFHVTAKDVTVEPGTPFSATAQGSISVSAGISTLSASGVFGGLARRCQGGTITLSGCSNAANNGTFSIRFSDVNAIDWANPSGVAENLATSGASWSTSGNAAPVLDRKNGYQFGYTLLSGAFSVNDVFLPGKRVLASGFRPGFGFTYRWMDRNNVDCASQFNGSGPVSLFMYFYLLSGASGNITPIMVRDQNTGSGGTLLDYIRLTYGTPASGVNYVRNDNPGQTVWNASPAVPLNTDAWQSLVITHDGTGGANAVKWYKNGTFAGSDPTARTQRTLSGLLSTHLGSANNTGTSNPGNGHAMAVAGWAGATAEWSAAEVQALHNWYVSEYA